MKVFTREIIENFANPMAEHSYEKAFEWLENSCVGIVEQLRRKTPILTEDYEMVLVGDMLSETSTPNSEIDVFLAFNAPQLELNSIKLTDEKLKRFWFKLKRAYKQSREEKKSKRKKKKKESEIKKEIEVPINKYSILNLKRQLVLYSARTLEEGGVIYTKDTSIKIVAREEIGVDINIYPAIKTEQGYKIYSENTNKFVEYSFEELKDNLTKKIEQVGTTYLDLVRVYKNLYFNINSSLLPSPYLIESLIYNCPDELFFGNNFYEVFIKILNYLHNANLQDFVLINDTNQKIFTSNLINESLANIFSFVRKIDEMI